MRVNGGHRQKSIDFQQHHFRKWPSGSHIGFLGFQTLTLVWLLCRILGLIIEVKWCKCIFAVKWIMIIIGSGNEMWPLRHQAINWTSDDLLLNGNTLQWNLAKNTEILTSKNMFENYVYKISVKTIASNHGLLWLITWSISRVGWQIHTIYLSMVDFIK